MSVKRVVIVPYKMGSKSAKALKGALVAKDIRCFRKRTDSHFLPKRSDLIVYYGGTDSLDNADGITLNTFRAIAQNKLHTLRALTARQLSCVEWTTDPELTRTWEQVVCRHTLTGHSGQGIEVINRQEQDIILPRVPLYTKYTKRKFECRIHVFNGTVIDAQIKRKVAGAEEVNTLIRNHHTGWVYCRDNYEASEECKALAIAAVDAVGLDFGAVDIIYNDYHKQYYVLEVNTAPGLEGTTLTNYVKAITNVIKTL
jgi:hypothetical protein